MGKGKAGQQISPSGPRGPSRGQEHGVRHAVGKEPETASSELTAEARIRILSRKALCSHLSSACFVSPRPPPPRRPAPATCRIKAQCGRSWGLCWSWRGEGTRDSWTNTAPRREMPSGKKKPL